MKQRYLKFCIIKLSNKTKGFLAGLLLLTLSSCYVGVEDEHHHHWHHYHHHDAVIVGVHASMDTVQQQNTAQR